MNFKGKPEIKSHEQYYEYQGVDPEYGDYINEVHRIVFDTSKDYSPYLEFNPEVKAIADIHVTNQEIVLYYNKEVLCRSLKTSYNNENILIGKREFIQITGIQIGLILINMPEMFVYVFHQIQPKMVRQFLI